jgi:hypothetical protein
MKGLLAEGSIKPIPLLCLSICEKYRTALFSMDKKILTPRLAFVREQHTGTFPLSSPNTYSFINLFSPQIKHGFYFIVHTSLNPASTPTKSTSTPPTQSASQIHSETHPFPKHRFRHIKVKNLNNGVPTPQSPTPCLYITTLHSHCGHLETKTFNAVTCPLAALPTPRPPVCLRRARMPQPSHPLHQTHPVQ